MTEQPRRIMAVLAHPDDESFGMGGTLAYYADQGVEVYYVCATRGEAGEVDPVYLNGYKSIAELRTAELSCAANHLGIKEVFYLNYRDSGMPGSESIKHPEALANQPVEEVAGKVVQYLRKYKPDVVLTFDPVGGYHHPDHIAIQRATLMAYEAAGDESQFPGEHPAFQPTKLYYHVFPRKVLRTIVRIMQFFGKDPSKFGQNGDIDLVKMAGDKDYPQHVKINFGPYAKNKEDASQCHASQVSGGGGFGSFLWTLFRKFSRINQDSFMQALPEVPENYRQKDLFA